MVSSTEQWSIAGILGTFGIDLAVEPVQIAPISRIVAVVASVPFEGGMLPIFPLAPLVIHAGDEMDLSGSLDQLVTVLLPLYGPNAEIHVLTGDGIQATTVGELKRFSEGMPHRHPEPERSEGEGSPGEAGIGGCHVPPSAGDSSHARNDEHRSLLAEATQTKAALGSLAKVHALCIPAADPLVNGADPRAMQQIVARLRRPDGCSWDRKQTYASLSKNLVDEVYETVDAINQNDVANLAEELGDLYMLILMLAQIAHEAGDFSIEDVYAVIARKMVGRHPHVFGDKVVNSESDLARIWAVAKAREASDSGKRRGKEIDGEPFSMPALARAPRVLKAYPVAEGDGSPELLRLVARIVASGDDPDALLREQLREHVVASTLDEHS